VTKPVTQPVTNSIKLHIKYFASVREALAKDSETLITSAATVADLRAELVAKGEPYANTLNDARLRAAVNHAMVGYDAKVSEGDEIAFFPPVTGG
jgi:sulfur-carrier protein